MELCGTQLSDFVDGGPTWCCFKSVWQCTSAPQVDGSDLIGWHPIISHILWKNMENNPAMFETTNQIWLAPNAPPGDIAQVVISIINRPRLWILTPQISCWIPGHFWVFNVKCLNTWNCYRKDLKVMIDCWNLFQQHISKKKISIQRVYAGWPAGCKIAGRTTLAIVLYSIVKNQVARLQDRCKIKQSPSAILESTIPHLWRSPLKKEHFKNTAKKSIGT